MGPDERFTHWSLTEKMLEIYTHNNERESGTLTPFLRDKYIFQRANGEICTPHRLTLPPTDLVEYTCNIYIYSNLLSQEQETAIKNKLILYGKCKMCLSSSFILPNIINKSSNREHLFLCADSLNPLSVTQIHNNLYLYIIPVCSNNSKQIKPRKYYIHQFYWILRMGRRKSRCRMIRPALF